LIAANLFWPQQLWRLLEVPSEKRDLLQVRSLSVAGEIPDLHVFGHSLAKRGHEEAPLRNGNLLHAAPPCFRKGAVREKKTVK
jgi:hypothetical protein